MGLFSQVAKGLSSQVVGRAVRGGGKNLIKGITRGSGKIIKGLKGSSKSVIKGIKAGSRQIETIPRSINRQIPIVQREVSMVRDGFGETLTKGQQLKLLAKGVRQDMRQASKLGSIIDDLNPEQVALRQRGITGMRNFEANFKSRGIGDKASVGFRQAKQGVKGLFAKGKDTATELAKDQLVGRAVLGTGGLLATGGTTVGATIAGNKLSKI